MAQATWKFVTEASNSPGVLLDMNNQQGGLYLVSGSLNLDSPELQDSFLPDDIPTEDLYQPRMLKFELYISGSNQAAKFSSLVTLLAKEEGLIMYSPGYPVDPVFFRMIERSDRYTLDKDGKREAWKIACSVVAAPFAIGPRIDIPDIIVNNDPEAGSNPLCFDLPPIQGDAPSPAVVQARTNGMAEPTMAFAQRTKNNPEALTLHAQAENGTLGTDTVLGGHSAAMSGSGSGVNPIVNPGGEIGSGSPPGWTASAGSVISTTAQFRSGTKSLRYDATAASGTRVINSVSFAIVVGTSYTASAWLRVGAGPMTQGRVNIRWFDSGGATLSTNVGSFVTMTTTWQQATVTATAPSGAVEAHVRIEFSPDPLAVASHAYIDDVEWTPGANFVRCNFATAGTTVATRVTVTAPGATSSEAIRGRYRVLVRVRASGNPTADAFILRYRINPGGQSAIGDQVIFGGNGGAASVQDLGIIELPAFQVPRKIGYSNLDPGLVPVQIAIEASRIRGTNNLDIDYIFLIPVSERYSVFNQQNNMYWMIIDGPNESVYSMAGTSSAFGATVATRVADNGGGMNPHTGGVPILIPGSTNRWYWIKMGSSGITTDHLLRISYWPSYREVAV